MRHTLPWQLWVSSCKCKFPKILLKVRLRDVAFPTSLCIYLFQRIVEKELLVDKQIGQEPLATLPQKLLLTHYYCTSTQSYTVFLLS